MRSRSQAFLLALVAALHTSSALSASASACKLDPEKLIAIARADQDKACPRADSCQFHVIQHVKQCAVQVWPLPMNAKSFVVLFISSEGKVVRRNNGR
jgi:hypothetical protein